MPSELLARRFPLPRLIVSSVWLIVPHCSRNGNSAPLCSCVKMPVGHIRGKESGFVRIGLFRVLQSAS